ncbi:MAG: two-component system chemotaxis response regulator CheY [bacterium]|jgi:two-component system chemotaxis response regulator CheY
MKILIVDDDLICRKLLHTILKQYGECDIAVNGLEAVEYFENSLKSESYYKLVFLDIMMPEMNGHETLKRIRELEDKYNIDLGSGVQVVMTTALGDTQNVLSAFSEGCEYYLVKPVQRQKLHELLVDIGVTT